MDQAIVQELADRLKVFLANHYKELSWEVDEEFTRANNVASCKTVYRADMDITIILAHYTLDSQIQIILIYGDRELMRGSITSKVNEQLYNNFIKLINDCFDKLKAKVLALSEDVISLLEKDFNK